MNTANQPAPKTLFDRLARPVIQVLGVLLCLFTLVEVNYSLMQPQASLAVFVMFGLVLCFLTFPTHPRLAGSLTAKSADMILAILSVVCCGYVIIQTEPRFQEYWASGLSLGNRAGVETTADFVIGLIGLLLVLEATRRSIGAIVPLLAILFMAHSYYCYGANYYDWLAVPDWMLPHAGQSMKDIVSTTFLQSLGVFGPAADVMFRYVFLFVVFGSFLEMSGATQFIIDFATKTFGRIRGGPAMVAVMASGLMGSLSGSAVANAVTTGTFTIPMMRSARFPRHIAGGITAAAASGGALVPPVMGAGAYMMLELVQPPVSFVQIMQSAAIPAVLFYFSILSIVFLFSRKLNATALSDMDLQQRSLMQFEAVVFFGALGTLIALLIVGFTPFRAVTAALAVILVLAAMRRRLQISLGPRVLALIVFFAVVAMHQFTAGYAGQAPDWLTPFLASGWIHPSTGDTDTILLIESLVGSAIVGMLFLILFGLVHPAWRPEMLKALTKSAMNAVSLVAASACVGIIIGIVQQTGIANDFSAEIKGIVDTNLFLALVGIMVTSLILGMGVPSVVCYLLMATLMGSLLEELGVVPLAAHLFIFYFGMMSMVTPPVALAGYASATIAESPIMQTSFAAFRFSLVGFTLPFMFVYRPALLLLSNEGESLTTFAIFHAVAAAMVGIVALACGLVGYARSVLYLPERVVMFVAAGLLLAPITQIGEVRVGLWIDILGALICFVMIGLNFMRRPRPLAPVPAAP